MKPIGFWSKISLDTGMYVSIGSPKYDRSFRVPLVPIRIVDVEEFEVARAILAGETQLLSQGIQSKHIFELCIAFGHQSTAAALLTQVPGCKVEAWHLGPFASEARSPLVRFFGCQCGSTWDTCSFCCWGWDIESGVWMQDWDAELGDAIACAREAAQRPVARVLLGLLGVLRSGEGFRNLEVSDEATARLLDLAILMGDKDLAERCARHRAKRPLRRWCSQDFFPFCGNALVSVSAPDVLAAALLAGVALQELNRAIPGCQCVMPLREAIALCGDMQLWETLAPLLPEGQKPWIPYTCDYTALFFCNCDPDLHWNWELCMSRLQTATLANMALGEFAVDAEYGNESSCYTCGVHGMTVDIYDPFRLMDIAVLNGQSACAELLASVGASSSKWTCQACLPDQRCHDCGEVALSVAMVPLEERRAAAGAALRVALARAWRLAAPMGLGIYQALRACSCGKMAPKPLVKIILSFAAERPHIACVLEGLEEELEQSAGALQEQAPHEVASETSHVEAVRDGETEVQGMEDAKSTDDLLTALRNSRDEMMPLSPDGVICFKLTRKANAPHVNELLFDAEGPLADLHRRVLNAGCEVAPEWSPVKALFVPLTQAQLLELTEDGTRSFASWFLLRHDVLTASL